jgi:urea transport system permease protein
MTRLRVGGRWRPTQTANAGTSDMRTFCERLLALVFALSVVCVAANAARADAYEDGLAHFLADSFDDTIQGINAVAASGHPLAEKVLVALRAGRLLFSAEQKRVFFKDEADSLLDAASGSPAASSPSDLAQVRLNNRLRNILTATLGNLTLLSPDPARRFDAAQAVLKSRDANALPTLEQAIAKETIARIKRALIEARAAVILYSETSAEADKIDAVAVIRDRGDNDALGLLRGLPASTPPAVKQLAAEAIAGIERTMAAWETVQNAWYGLSLGSVLLLAAIGLAITFGVMGVINMAHGEMVMLGAYTTFIVQQIMRAYSPDLLDYSLVIAVPLAFLVTGLVGILIERGIIRFLYGRPLDTLLATWGLSLVLQQAVRTAFGPTNKDVSSPSWMSGSFNLGHISITNNRLCIVLFTLAVFVLLLALLRYTRLGLEMRAVTQNRTMAASMGIRTGWIDAMTFGLGSGIAGIAGVALSQIDNVSPNLGQGYIIDSFMVVVFGGVGNLWGTLVGALTLGIANKFLEPFAGAVLGKIAILVLIILFIQKRPRGLFALKGRAVEA